MTSYKVLDEHPIVSTEKDDDADGSGKMIQVIIPTDESPRADVRFGYKGPSGKFINNPPTFNPSEETEEEVLEKTKAAFSKARLYRLAIERLQEAGVPDERIPGVLDLIEEESNIEEVVELATS
jgi:hypothetical protein